MWGDTCHGVIATREKEIDNNMGCLKAFRSERKWEETSCLVQLSEEHPWVHEVGVGWHHLWQINPPRRKTWPVVFSLSWVERKAETFFWPFQNCMSVGVGFLSYRHVRAVINCLALSKQWKRFQTEFLKVRGNNRNLSFQIRSEILFLPWIKRPKLTPVIIYRPFSEHILWLKLFI